LKVNTQNREERSGGIVIEKWGTERGVCVREKQKSGRREVGSKPLRMIDD
jgi:hypothetical protein